MACVFKPGESVKYFICPSSSSQEFHFHTIAGRYIILSFFGSTKLKENYKRHEFISENLDKHLDDKKISYFGVTIDQDDFNGKTGLKSKAGVRFFWDITNKISVGYGALKAAFMESANPEKLTAFEGFTLVIDPNMRAMEVFDYTDKDHDKKLKKYVQELPEIDAYTGAEDLSAPVMIMPRIFEPELCEELIKYFDKKGGAESGFIQGSGEETTGIINYTFKRRKDCMIDDKKLLSSVRERIVERLVPQIQKAFHYEATRIERYIISSYDSKTKDFFRAHRDDTGKGTAHRKFAITINLNAEDYTGGDLCFPEYGSKLYKAPTGGAVVYSCKLLHEVKPVTKGKRYAFLPFLYDEEAAKVKEFNNEALTGMDFNREMERKIVGSPNDDPLEAISFVSQDNEAKKEEPIKDTKKKTSAKPKKATKAKKSAKSKKTAKK